MQLQDNVSYSQMSLTSSLTTAQTDALSSALQCTKSKAVVWQRELGIPVLNPAAQWGLHVG